MNYIEILFLSYALSMDAAIVSFGYGLAFKDKRLKNSLMLAFFTGLFQFLMPFIGWFLVGFIYDYVSSLANVIAGTIFLILSGKFIYDAIKKEDNEEPKCLSCSCLFLIAIATSIDALCAGTNICLLGGNILKSSLIIGIITFINSFISFHTSVLLKKINSQILEIASGIILILLSLKIYFS